jgi:hypothetical protein
MSVVWAALGAVMGASVGMEGGGIIGAIAGMMAGIVEFAMLGAIFAVVGGRPEETILGAVGGLLGGLTVGITVGQDSVVLLANLGLLVGAIVGATLRPYLRLLSLPAILLCRILHRQQRPAVITVVNDGRIEHRPFVPALHRPAPVSHPQAVRGPLRHEPVALPRAEGTPSND